MRLARLCLFTALLGCAGIFAQRETTFRSNVPLVIVPTTITDKQGRPVEGLTEGDLVLYDNSVAQRTHFEDVFQPISLVLVLQTSAEPLLGKVRRLGGLIEPLLTGQDGEAALITFNEKVHVEQEFTRDVQKIANSLKILKQSGDGSSSIDAVARAVELLKGRPVNRRRVILLAGEGRDRTSETKLGEAVFLAQKENITIFGITFSRMLLPFTPKGDAPALQEAQEVPKPGPMNLPGLFGELKRVSSPHSAETMAKYTGGRVDSILRKSGMEAALERVGSDLHMQYLLSFTPASSAVAAFHEIRVEVKGRPELTVRTRAGYWSLP